MIRKFTAVLLCAVLSLTLSVNVFAETSGRDTQSTIDMQVAPVIEDIEINVDENGNSQIAEPITLIDGISLTSTGATPIGHLDTVSSSIIGGWAYQSDIPNTALTVHIYIINNSTGEEVVIPVTADGYRADLAAAGYGNGYHAYQYIIDWKEYKPATYTVRAYAIGVNSINPQLNNSPKSFTVRNPEGTVDEISSSLIGGWAWKPDAPDSAIDVHIYIYKSDGTQLAGYYVAANEYRSDLEAAGYGNGVHGFSKAIDWSAFPEEELWVVVYAVDGSGYNPSFYSGYYDNRKQISLLGMVDSDNIDRSTWVWQSEIETYCNNIGCSSLLRNYIANDSYYTSVIRDSSYCAIATHGASYETETGEIIPIYDRIQWSMKGVYNEHIDCTNKYCGTCYGWYTTSDLNDLPDNYFSSTRCVALVACYAANGGKENSENFVNTLHNKGVWTVIGFKNPTSTVIYDGTTTVNPQKGSQRWLTEFTKFIGLGESVKEAANLARSQISNDCGYANLLNWGLDEENTCIVGDENQIVKH